MLELKIVTMNNSSNPSAYLNHIQHFYANGNTDIWKRLENEVLGKKKSYN
jgi:hypothetical protein